MSEKATREALATAARKWVKAAEACNRWMQEHVASSWPASGEPAPPEPKHVTRKARDEYQRLRLAEQEAEEEFFRISGALLGRS
jgi:hypothetical protein